MVTWLSGAPASGALFRAEAAVSAVNVPVQDQLLCVVVQDQPGAGEPPPLATVAIAVLRGAEPDSVPLKVTVVPVAGPIGVNESLKIVYAKPAVVVADAADRS